MDQPPSNNACSYNTVKLKVVSNQIMCNDRQFVMQKPIKSAAAKRSALARRKAKEHIYSLQKSREDLQMDNDNCLRCIKELEKEYEQLVAEVSRYRSRIKMISITTEDFEPFEDAAKLELDQMKSTVMLSSNVVSSRSHIGSEDAGNVSLP